MEARKKALGAGAGSMFVSATVKREVVEVKVEAELPIKTEDVDSSEDRVKQEKKEKKKKRKERKIEEQEMKVEAPEIVLEDTRSEKKKKKKKRIDEEVKGESTEPFLAEKIDDHEPSGEQERRSDIKQVDLKTEIMDDAETETKRAKKKRRRE